MSLISLYLIVHQTFIILAIFATSMPQGPIFRLQRHSEAYITSCNKTKVIKLIALIFMQYSGRLVMNVKVLV